MKKLLYLIPILLCCANVFAQNTTSDKDTYFGCGNGLLYHSPSNEHYKGRLQISLSTGVASPLEKFSTYNSPVLGCAKMGNVSGLELSYTFIKNCELVLSGNYYINPVDAHKLAEGIWEEHRTASQVSIIDATPYNMGNVMLGIRPFLPLFGEKMAVFAGAEGGMLFAKTPSFTQEIALSSPLHQDIKGASSSAFCYQAHGGLQYNFNYMAAISLFAEYLNSNPSFDFTRSDKTNAPTQTISQRIQMLNVGLKFNYLLPARKAKD